MAHRVALALSDGVPIFELAAPCAIFGTDRSDLTVGDWYDFVVCSPAGARVDAWFTASTPYTYADLATAETVIVPACHDEAFDPPADLVEAVRIAYANGARIVSICTGAFVLAEAGLLNGRRAATHWMHARRLAERYPEVDVDAAALYVDEGRILTSAGKSAGTDLCLHLVRQDHGAQVANQIARRLVTAPHREGTQRQYVDIAEPPVAHDDVGIVMDWAVSRLDQFITVEQMAREANVSVRTLNRHFRARIGTNPLEWLNDQRVRRAQYLLESTDISVEEVAARCGFGTSVALRRHFRQALATTPGRYRRRFAG